MSTQYSIIIPVYNEADIIVERLQALQTLRQQGVELIVVDGGSSDDTCRLARDHACQLVSSRPGRAWQMNSGAAVARGERLIFLHLDTQLPQAFIHELSAVSQPWGFCCVGFDSRSAAMQSIAFMMNWRTRLTCVATGDQALFINKTLFDALGGYADIPLMEDVELCKRLRLESRPGIIKAPVITAARRWQKKGIFKTVLQMWYLRGLFFLGICPWVLAETYYPNINFGSKVDDS